MIRKVGAPSKYKRKYCQGLFDFFDIPHTRVIIKKIGGPNGKFIGHKQEIANNLPTVEGFCARICISRDTFYEWVKQHAEFSDTVKRVRTIQQNMWIQNSMKGLYNTQFSILFGKNVYGWRDKTDIDHTSGGEKIEVQLVTYSGESAK